jgi:uncharacterized membrane protein
MNVGLGADREWLAHDAFRDEALGDEGWLILRIAATSSSVSEVALRAGFSIEIFFLACVITAGIFGGLTAKRSGGVSKIKKSSCG